MDTRRIIVGIDLNKTQPQICYFEQSTQDTQTAPMKIGSENASFQDILETAEVLAEDSGLPADKREEMMRYLVTQATDLLVGALSTLGIDNPEEQIEGMMITAEKLSRPLVSVIRAMFRKLGLGNERAFLQDYRESFYYHTLYQKSELWNRNVGFFRFSSRDVTFFSMSMDRMTRPITVKIDEGITIHLSEDRKKWDEQFYNMANASLRQNMYTSIFLMGETFDKAWAARSTSLLCKGGRKVFVVDNLYARGACYAARDKVCGKRLGEYLYLGEDLIRQNIGMEMIVQGTPTFYPLISAGVNWYETEKTCECILEEAPELIFILSGMEDGLRRFSKMQLTGMPPRPPKASRVRLHLSYASPKQCVIEVEDLGFGEFFPSSGKVWREIWEG